MTEFINYKIKDITEKVGSGSTPRGGQKVYLDEGPYTLIRSQNIYDFEFHNDGLVYIEKEHADQLKNVALKENDILLNITGDSVGRCCKVPKDVLPARVNQHVAIIRANDSVDPYFLMCYLNESRNKRALLNLVHGGTRKALTKGIIEDFEVQLPSLREQIEISNILKNLDKKININAKINKNIEQMAMALYKHWFVDFNSFQEREFEESEFGMVPKGWKVSTLDDLIENTLGGDWGKPESIDDFTEEVLCVRGTDIPKLLKGEKSDIPKRFIKQNSVEKRKLKSGDIILEKSGGSPTQSTGRAVLINNELSERFDKELVYTNFCVRFKLKDLSYQHIVHQKLQKLYNEGIFFTYENGTTGIKNLDVKGILSKEFVAIPNKEILDTFNHKIEMIRTMIQKNGNENESLSNLRDYLLPKLLSGEIDVTKAKEKVKETIL